MFVHFLHDQLLNLANGRENAGSRRQAAAVREALRWVTFLTSDPLYIPTVDLAQSPVAEALSNDLALLAHENFVHFVGSSVVLDDLYRSKTAHFNRTSLSAPWQDRDAKGRLQRFEGSLQARRINTTADLKLRWMADFGRFANSGPAAPQSPLSRQMHQTAVLLGRDPNERRFQAALSFVPKRLEEHAFLWKVVEDLKIFPFRTTGAPRHQLEVGLAWQWIESHLDEYRTALPVRLGALGTMDFGVMETDPDKVINLESYREAMRVLGLGEAFASLTLAEIIALRRDPAILGFRDGLLATAAQRLGGTGGDDDAVGLYRRCQEVRDAAAEARAPLAAMSAAGQIALRDEEGLAPITSPAPPRNVRVAVMVALVEEMKTIKDFVEKEVGSLATEYDVEGRPIYRLVPIDTVDGVKLDVFFAVVGRGQEDAAVRTTAILTHHRVDVAVNVGIAGSLSDDVGLGDVVVGTEIYSYVANAKAVSDGSGGFDLLRGGRTETADRYLADRASDLPLRVPEVVANYRRRLGKLAGDLLGDSDLLGSVAFDIAAGPIASGPVVAAAPEFKEWLLAAKRDLMAVEMESSGIGIATAEASAQRRVRFVALRGISDFGDADKTALEEETKGAVRRLATIAPLVVLLSLLESLPGEALQRFADEAPTLK